MASQVGNKQHEQRQREETFQCYLGDYAQFDTAPGSERSEMRLEG